MGETTLKYICVIRMVLGGMFDMKITALLAEDFHPVIFSATFFSGSPDGEKVKLIWEVF